MQSENSLLTVIKLAVYKCASWLIALARLVEGYLASKSSLERKALLLIAIVSINIAIIYKVLASFEVRYRHLDKAIAAKQGVHGLLLQKSAQLKERLEGAKSVDVGALKEQLRGLKKSALALDKKEVALALRYCGSLGGLRLLGASKDADGKDASGKGKGSTDSRGASRKGTDSKSASGTDSRGASSYAMMLASRELEIAKTAKQVASKKEREDKTYGIIDRGGEVVLGVKLSSKNRADLGLASFSSEGIEGRLLRSKARARALDTAHLFPASPYEIAGSLDALLYAKGSWLRAIYLSPYLRDLRGSIKRLDTSREARYTLRLSWEGCRGDLAPSF